VLVSVVGVFGEGRDELVTGFERNRSDLDIRRAYHIRSEVGEEEEEVPVEVDPGAEEERLEVAVVEGSVVLKEEEEMVEGMVAESDLEHRT